MFDTGSPFLWVPNENCTTYCHTDDFYDTRKSETYKIINETTNKITY